MSTKHPLAIFASRPGNSLTKIAKEAGCSRQTLYRIMGGEENTTIEMLRRISAATGHAVSVEDLIRRETAA